MLGFTFGPGPKLLGDALSHLHKTSFFTARNGLLVMKKASYGIDPLTSAKYFQRGAILVGKRDGINDVSVSIHTTVGPFSSAFGYIQRRNQITQIYKECSLPSQGTMYFLYKADHWWYCFCKAGRYCSHRKTKYRQRSQQDVLHGLRRKGIPRSVYNLIMSHCIRD